MKLGACREKDDPKTDQAADIDSQRSHVKPGSQHSQELSPTQQAPFLSRSTRGVIGFYDCVELILKLCRRPLLAFADLPDLTRALIGEFLEFALAPGLQVRARPLPTLVGFPQRAANLKTERVFNHQGFLTMRAEKNIPDHELAGGYAIGLAAAKTADGNLPIIDFRQRGQTRRNVVGFSQRSRRRRTGGGFRRRARFACRW